MIPPLLLFLLGMKACAGRRWPSRASALWLLAGIPEAVSLYPAPVYVLDLPRFHHSPPWCDLPACLAVAGIGSSRLSPPRRHGELFSEPLPVTDPREGAGQEQDNGSHSALPGAGSQQGRAHLLLPAPASLISAGS